MAELHELTDAQYLRNLSERLHRIPVMFGVDSYDVDHCRTIARKLDATIDIRDLIESIDQFHGNELKDRDETSIAEEIAVIKDILK